MSVWKDFEREVAHWFGTARNIGSGKINSNDEGDPRPGDVICKPGWGALIECKTRKDFPKSGSYNRALATSNEAKKEKLRSWFHFERKNGSKQVYILATNGEWMERICTFIVNELDKEKDDNTSTI